MAEGFRWGCDDVAEGSLHNSDNPAGAQVADDDNYRQLVTSLEAARAQGRERSRAAQEATVDGDGGAAAPMPDASASLEQTFAALTTFALRTATDGGPELRLYDATQNPDKLMMKYGYFVAEGFLIVQQLLQLPGFRVASILSSEPTLRKLVPDIVREDGRLRALPADVADAECGAGTPHSGEPAGTAPSSTPGCCCVYVCNRGDISRITGFKHSALATLAIVHRPVGRPPSKPPHPTPCARARHTRPADGPPGTRQAGWRAPRTPPLLVRSVTFTRPWHLGCPRCDRPPRRRCS